jgi:hypothetical protein
MYFSAASARAASVGNGSVWRSGWGWGYMNWKRGPRTEAGSESSTVSSQSEEDGFGGRVASAAPANTPECVSRFLRWTLKRTPSEEETVRSASGAQTAFVESERQWMGPGIELKVRTFWGCLGSRHERSFWRGRGGVVEYILI